MITLPARLRGGTAASSSPAPRQTLRHRLRSALVATLSAIVMLGGAVYVFAPSGASAELSVREMSESDVPPDFDADVLPEYTLVSARVADRRRWRQVFYGSIDAKGVPVSRVVLKVRGLSKKTRRHGATIRVGKKKTFRSVVRLRPGRYSLTLSMRVGKRTKTITTTRKVRNKRAYAIRVKVRESGVVTFFPVTSY